MPHLTEIMITLSIQPVSIVTHDGRQWLDIHGESPRVVHGRLRAIRLPDQTLLDETSIALDSGHFHQRALLHAPQEDLRGGGFAFSWLFLSA